MWKTLVMCGTDLSPISTSIPRLTEIRSTDFRIAAHTNPHTRVSNGFWFETCGYHNGPYPSPVLICVQQTDLGKFWHAWVPTCISRIEPGRSPPFIGNGWSTTTWDFSHKRLAGEPRLASTQPPFIGVRIHKQDPQVRTTSRGSWSNESCSTNQLQTL